MQDRMNIVVVVVDTLRAADVGCYGNPHIRTPHMDALAGDGLRFTEAYPESLPTIPVRRALCTGRRAYPFRNYRHMKWGTVKLPGWQPIAEEESTLAEDLATAGYQTGFVCTTQHCWNPGFNFQRGFWQWEFVRGYSGEDRWGSPFGVPREALEPYGDVDQMLARPHKGNGPPMVLANRGRNQPDEETATARAFKWAADFVGDNRNVPFYLLIDSFAPHEPWEAPEPYYRLYGDPDYKGKRLIVSCYGPADGYAPGETAYLQANYRGLVTHVDHWFGVFMDRLQKEGLADNTAVLLISDHGTNFCENPHRIIGKPATSMYPGLMALPFVASIPGQPTAGAACDALVYNHDLTATVYDIAGVTPEQPLDGRSLVPLCRGEDRPSTRDYVTCRYGNALCCIDCETWALGNIDGDMQEVFDRQADPGCRTPLPAAEAAPRWSRAWQRLLADAGGEFPDYREAPGTDALGR